MITHKYWDQIIIRSINYRSRRGARTNVTDGGKREKKGDNPLIRVCIYGEVYYNQ